jgi:hypothetical protein
MTGTGKSAALSAKQSSRKPKAAHGVQGGSGLANRLAVAILEVLAGVRTPTDAAAALEISLPRYYQLETRAVEGLVQACEPRCRGKQPSLAKRVAELERQLEQAQREAARQQALLRAAHRSLGLKAPPEPGKAPDKQARDAKGRRKRRPTVRALKAARVLKQRVGSDTAESLKLLATDDEGAASAATVRGTG